MRSAYPGNISNVYYDTKIAGYTNFNNTPYYKGGFYLGDTYLINDINYGVKYIAASDIRTLETGTSLLSVLSNLKDDNGNILGVDSYSSDIEINSSTPFAYPGEGKFNCGMTHYMQAFYPDGKTKSAKTPFYVPNGSAYWTFYISPNMNLEVTTEHLYSSDGSKVEGVVWTDDLFSSNSFYPNAKSKFISYDGLYKDIPDLLFLAMSVDDNDIYCGDATLGTGGIYGGSNSPSLDHCNASIPRGTERILRAKGFPDGAKITWTGCTVDSIDPTICYVSVTSNKQVHVTFGGLQKVNLSGSILYETKDSCDNKIGIINDYSLKLKSTTSNNIYTCSLTKSEDNKYYIGYSCDFELTGADQSRDEITLEIVDYDKYFEDESFTDADTCAGGNLTRSLTFDTSTGTITRNLLVKNTKNWFKLKDVTYSSVSNLLNRIPLDALGFDEEDNESNVFILNQGGVVSANGTINLGSVTDKTSSFVNWRLPNYSSSTNISINTYKDFILSKGTTTLGSDLSSVSSGVFYFTGSELILKNSDLSRIPDKTVIVTDAEIKISGESSFSPEVFNSDKKSLMFVSTKKISFDDAVKEAHGIFIGKEVDAGSTNDLGLKIVGNLVSEEPIVSTNRQWATNLKPALFVVFYPKYYLDLISASYVSNYEWNELD